MTDVETLMSYRFKQAEETIQDAEAMLKVRISSRSIINRAYYAMFYAVLALFLKENINVKTSKHSGVISLFDREFILSGKIDKRFSQSLHKMFNVRQEADYKELVEITHQDAEEKVRIAKEFIGMIKQLTQTTQQTQ